MKIMTADQFKRQTCQTTIDQTLDQTVLNIIEDVQKNGDKAYISIRNHLMALI